MSKRWRKMFFWKFVILWSFGESDDNLVIRLWWCQDVLARRLLDAALIERKTRPNGFALKQPLPKTTFDNLRSGTPTKFSWNNQNKQSAFGEKRSVDTCAYCFRNSDCNLVLNCSSDLWDDKTEFFCRGFVPVLGGMDVVLRK